MVIGMRDHDTKNFNKKRFLFLKLYLAINLNLVYIQYSAGGLRSLPAASRRRPFESTADFLFKPLRRRLRARLGPFRRIVNFRLRRLTSGKFLERCREKVGCSLLTAVIAAGVGACWRRGAFTAGAREHGGAHNGARHWLTALGQHSVYIKISWT